MSDGNLALPVYSSPPIHEVVYGIVFSPLTKLLAPHFGALWDLYMPEYITCKEAPPIAAQLEGTGSLPSVIEYTDVPPLPRIWFVDAGENKVVQVQRERFHHNWRKVKPDDEYPRNAEMLRTFRDRLDEFVGFIAKKDLGVIVLQQCELSYVNHIVIEEGLTGIQMMNKVFPDFQWRTQEGRFQGQPEGINWKMIFGLPSKSGKIHVSIQTAIKSPGLIPIIMMDLTARGISGDQTDSMWAWFEMAHYQIVQTFADLANVEFQASAWGRHR